MPHAVRFGAAIDLRGRYKHPVCTSEAFAAQPARLQAGGPQAAPLAFRRIGSSEPRFGRNALTLAQACVSVSCGRIGVCSCRWRSTHHWVLIHRTDRMPAPVTELHAIDILVHACFAPRSRDCQAGEAPSP